MSKYAAKGERKARLFPTGFEATIPCKRCGKSFQSTDRRSVRHCDRCRQTLNYLSDMVGIGWEVCP